VFEEYLRWSRDLQIEVYVGNVRDEGQYPSELPLIREYNRILHPHVRRCKVIDYEVQYSTSLPCLLRDLRDIPPFLESLRLKSEQIAGAHASPSENEDDPQEFHSTGWLVAQSAQPFTSLNHLVLNGRNFLLACAYLPGLLTNAGRIVVENYRKTLRLHPETDRIPFQFRSMLGMLASHNRARYLKFNNFEFQNINDLMNELFEGASVHTHPVVLPLVVLELSNISKGTLYQLLVNVQMGSIALVIFDSIDLSGFNTDSVLSFRHVELRNMSCANIRCFLRLWHGTWLSLRDCPGLTDDIIDEMGVPKAPGRPLPLSKLEIHNCQNFSVGSLKAMMASRHQYFLMAFAGRFQSALVASQAEIVPGLTVHGAKQHLTDEDRRWFNELENLCHFEWQASPLVLQEGGVDVDIEMEDDTELELQDATTAGGEYSNIEEEFDGEWYTAVELVIDWPLDETKSPPMSTTPDPMLAPPDSEAALWADVILDA
jgi:hypothetical protein